MPPPTDNIQCHMYEELSQPVAQLLLEPHVSHWQLLPEQPQDFEEQLSPRLSLTNHSHYQSPARELKAKSDKRSGTQPESLSAQPKHIFQHKSGYQKESIFSLLHQQTIKGCNGNWWSSYWQFIPYTKPPNTIRTAITLEQWLRFRWKGGLWDPPYHFWPGPYHFWVWTPPLHPSNALILAKWTGTSNKEWVTIWVLNTLSLDQHLAVDNLQSSPVLEDCNCCYHTIIKPGNLNLPFRKLKPQALTNINENEAWTSTHSNQHQQATKPECSFSKPWNRNSHLQWPTLITTCSAPTYSMDTAQDHYPQYH